MEWLTGLIASPVIAVAVPALLPVLLPRKKVYGMFHWIGTKIRLFKLSTDGKHPKFKGVIGYFWNTIPDALQGLGDGIGGVHKYDK